MEVQYFEIFHSSASVWDERQITRSIICIIQIKIHMIIFLSKGIWESYPSISEFEERKGKSAGKDAIGQGNKGGD